MNKKIAIIIAVVLVIVIIAVGFIFIQSKNNNDNTDNNDNNDDDVLTITLNSRQYINSLKKYTIAGTNDSVLITEAVKWEVPAHEEGVTVSFAIAIPYTITVDGKEYNGIYELGDSAWNTDDNNPKYDLTVTNLTKDGKIEILITEK